ncbi:MAG TPA: DUF305 domain-containing protein [Candidatus Saccharimonadales bacterium]
MQTKPLIYGIIGFLLGGLLVSTAAVSFNKPKADGGMTMQAMSESLKDKTGNDFDKAFISSMIEHHQGAIDMAVLSEKQAKHQEIKELSKTIVTMQEKEIAKMKHLQGMWNYTEMPASGSTH